MRTRQTTALVRLGLVGVASALLVACGAGSDGSGVAPRAVAVVINEETCAPARIDVRVGERLAVEVRNNAKGDREFEGIEGTQISEVLVPAGKLRTINYTVQQTDRPLKVKCYSPGGPSTIIELMPGVAPAATPGTR